MRNISILFMAYMTSFLMISCVKKDPKEVEQTPVVTVKTAPVTFGEIDNKLSFNGKTVYLKKNLVVSPIAGYVRKLSAKFGDSVSKGKLLFEIQTKENKALENSTSGNMGIVNVLAPSHGVINVLNITETGAYVVEGAPLCTVAESSDVMVQLNLPFEFNSLVKAGTRCSLILDKNTKFDGTVYRILPTVDEANQTQQILIKPHTNKPLPENLNLAVEILKARHSGSCLVPRDAIMTNETQTEFWVMKVVDNKLAIKVPITKGIENDDQVEAVSSGLTSTDRVIIEGAYGLNDSTVIKVAK
ncbi:MAG: HlyD family efflux transporter periplasmic adaptor subunit [Bacteroidota bacterium]|nr:HlyD family efflux transporter periplasmic adaptor subunit [Bacteroidota bacterium]